MKKISNWARRLGACLAGILVLAGIAAPPARAQGEWEDTLADISRLQQLAREYAAGQEKEPDSLLLTLNYLRARRYEDFSWDLILGPADEDFQALVAQQAPELAELQQIDLMTTPGGEQVDFIHLLAGAAGAWQGMPVICTWGGDCIQLAQAARGMDPAASRQTLEPLFGVSDQSSLFPLSDLLADLDGANLGAELTPEADLAQALESYYGQIDSQERCRRFTALQFGGGDTGSSEFAARVWDTFRQDEGVCLMLTLEGDMSRGEGDAQLSQEMAAPLETTCTLLAEYLGRELDGQTVAPPAEPTPESSPAESQPAGADNSGSAQTGQEEGLDGLLQAHPEYLLWAAGGLLGLAVLVLLVILAQGRRR